jgi:hypothetical protein
MQIKTKKRATFLRLPSNQNKKQMKKILITFLNMKGHWL